MKLEIELSESDVKEISGLENKMIKKIIAVHAGISVFTFEDRIISKVFDAFKIKVTQLKAK